MYKRQDELGRIIDGALADAKSKVEESIEAQIDASSEQVESCLLYTSAASILSVPAIEFGQFGDNALLIQTEICADVAINGYFILMPEQGSYEKILTSLGISL